MLVRLWHRFPRWVRWTLLGFVVLSALLLGYAPPRGKVPLQGWSPGCPELVATAWGERILTEAELPEFPRKALFNYSPGWCFFQDRMVSIGSIFSERRSHVVIVDCADSAPNLPVVAPNHQRMWGRSLQAWQVADDLWLPLFQQVPEAPTQVVLRKLDGNLETLQEVIVPFEIPHGYQWSHSDGLWRVESAAEEWYLLTSVVWELSNQTGRNLSAMYAWRFNPLTGEISEPTQVILPERSPNDAPIPTWEIALLTEGGYTGHSASPPYLVQPDGWLAGEAALPARLLEHEIPPRGRWVNPAPPSQIPAGRKHEFTNRILHSRERFAFHLGYLVSDLADRIPELIPVQAAQQAMPLEEAQYQLYRGARAAEREFNRFNQQHAVRYGQATLRTSWGGITPAAPELEQSVTATLDNCSWLSSPWQLPVLHGWVLDADSFLIAQLVLAPQSDSPEARRGLLRFGTLTQPASTIQWIGYVPLPPEFGRFQHRWQVDCHVTDEEWVIGLSACDYSLTRVRQGYWWTRMAAPIAVSATRHGWLSSFEHYRPEEWKEVATIANIARTPDETGASHE